MKFLKVFLVLLFLSASLAAFSQSSQLNENFNSGSMAGWKPISGNWRVMNGRLVQTDVNEKMAMIVVPVRQSGTMMYEFDVRYVGGGEDDYAGFGIHIGINNPSSRRSWGNGQSMLGWVTWDPRAYGSPGAFIQVYESRGSTRMGLDTRIFRGSDPVRYGGVLPVRSEYLDTEFLGATVPVKLMIDTRTGKGRFYDPFDPDRYFYSFDLGSPIRSGNYFALRTNSVALSFDNVKISRVY
jgi:hypothetical protein